jgi:glycosyltransferase involved in cell wall biosynthesis
MTEPGPIAVHMTGSEWFRSRPGGLNRYFESLYLALAEQPRLDVTAGAFGEAQPGGASWGPTGLPMAHRLYRSRRRTPGHRTGIVDRHFCLYGAPARSRKQKLVVHFQGPWAFESRTGGESRAAVTAKFWFERMRYARADAFVVLCQRFKDILVNEYRVPEAKVTVIPPGVDLTRFQAQPDTGEANVICVRRLERRMGIDYLIRAWAGVVAQAPSARLTVVGTGSQEATLRKLAQEYAPPGTIRFLGQVTDAELVRQYAEATISVIPSVELEGFGLTALESLAVGRAPIVTDCGGLPDAVTGLDASLVVAPRRSTELSARIIAALNGDRPSAEQCRAHAERFSWPAAAERHAELYGNLLK